MFTGTKQLFFFGRFLLGKGGNGVHLDLDLHGSVDVHGFD